MGDTKSGGSYLVFAGLVVYTVPAILVAVLKVPLQFGWVVILFVLVGASLILCGLKREYSIPKVWDLSKIDLSISDYQIIQTEYTELGQEIRYRDRIMVQSIYISLTVVALLGNIFLRSPAEIRPGIALIGSLIAFAFLISITSQRGSRDQLNEHRKDIEGQEGLRGVLSVGRTGIIRVDRPFFSNFSAALYIEILHKGFAFTWFVIYVYTTGNAIFGWSEAVSISV